MNVLAKLGVNQRLESTYTEAHSRLYNTTTLSFNKKPLVTFGTIQPNITEQFDLSQPVYMADFLWKNVMDVIRNNNMKFRPISAFPQVRRDLALVLDKQVTYGELERIALKSEPKLLQSINAFDVYVGDKIEQGKKSYAISVLLQDDEKTMTDQDIDRVVNKLVKQFEKELGATLRGGS
jgi:phenylalanyl-tRNA synthetase beta chain